MRELETKLHSVFEGCAASTDGPIGVAVSGGGDSLALLYMAYHWARQSQRQLFCMTVDHGLRAEAADEARFVGTHCAKLGITHRILKWTPAEGHVGQARSRRARHILLAEATRAAGSQLILMGHTQDDQQETLVMRRARGAVGYGLAAIRQFAVSPVWPEGRDVNIGRPLLGIRRTALRDYLREQQIDWVDDPSNFDPHYERVRTRKALECNTGSSWQNETTELGLMAEQARAKCDERLARWFREGVSTFDDGLLQFDPAQLRAFALDQDKLAEGLAWLLMCAAGHDRRANRESRMKLAGDILAEPHALQARTLGGAWVALRKKQITLARDPGRIAAQPQRIKTEQIWDGRFLFRDRQTEKYTANMARNLKNTPELTKISAMARETYPMIDADETEILCLNRRRLNQVAFMFDYDNLINQSVKKGDGLSLRKD